MNILGRAALCALLISPCLLCDASPLSAYVDKKAIEQGESITLTISYEGKADGEPDLSSLAQDFEIISKQNRSETSLINGRMAATTSWVLELIPKRPTKVVTIPPISFRSHKTLAIAITQSEERQANPRDGIALRVIADRSSVYVNAELIIDIEITTELSLSNGTLEALTIKDAIVEPLLEDEQGEEIRDGIRYFVFKRSYAVFPAKPGRLAIPSLAFHGQVIGPTRTQGIWGNFFDSKKSISSRSKELVIDVREVPREFPKGHEFLPLKSMTIIESFDDPDHKFELNKPSTRHFEIKALGAPASFLPTIKASSLKEVQIYAETGDKVQKGTKEGFMSSIKLSHVYMPVITGKVSVPEQTIYWWDTEKDALRTAVIRAMDLNIAGTMPVQEAQPVQKPDEVRDVEPLQQRPIEEQARTDLYKILTIAFAILWIITLSLGLWVYRSKKMNKEPMDLPVDREGHRLINEIKKSCRAREPKRVYEGLRDLKDWAYKNQRSDLPDEELNKLFYELEAIIYDVKNIEDRDQSLDAISKQISKIKMHPRGQAALKPFYPV